MIMCTLYARLQRLWSGPDLPPPGLAVLVDVRTPPEFSRGHLAGACSLPLDQLSAQAPSVLPEMDAQIVVYCQSGMRSSMARKALLKMGYRNVTNGGGIGKLARNLARQQQAKT
jgi:phage shock protein E